MSLQEEVLNSDLLRSRIMELEYDEITEESIRQIYMEETGKLAPQGIIVYYSDDYKDKSQIDYGFNGTIIHFYDESFGINQIYTIIRGSEVKEKDNWRPLDWMYNAFGIFTGQNTAQYDDAEIFHEKVLINIIQENHSKIELKKIGLGHSLGGNLITMIQLNTAQLDNVYTVNSAPTSYYQLAVLDRKFWLSISKEFHVNPSSYNEIYTIDPLELKKIAEEYYKEAGQNIQHLTTDNDLVTALFDAEIRGFFNVGTTEKPLNTLTSANGITEMLENIPDEAVKELQIFLSEYAEVYNDEGFDGVIQAMIGIDVTIIEGIVEDGMISFFWSNKVKLATVSIMILEASKKVPELIEKIELILQVIEPVLEASVELGHITSDDKDLILAELYEIDKSLKEMAQSIQSIINPLNLINLTTGRVVGLITHFKTIIKSYKSLQERFSLFNEYSKQLQLVFGGGIQAHQLQEVVKALSSLNGRRYKGKDMIISMTNHQKTIHVNLSSAIRVYLKGLQVYEKKRELLKKMKDAYQVEYNMHFNQHKKKLLKEIDDMERYPQMYQKLLGPFTSDTYRYYRIRKIIVDENIYELDSWYGSYQPFNQRFERMLHDLEKEIQSGEEYINSVKQTIEYFFEYEQSVIYQNYIPM